MSDLSANQQSFIGLMKKSDEHARRGFALLVKRADADLFFDALDAEGFFAPARNPGPVAGDSPGTVRIPFWAALEYLTACAKLAGDRPDMSLAGKVMAVVRAVTLAREPDGGIRNNHHTARYFAEIVGMLPAAATMLRDMDLVAEWVSVRFNPGGVALALDRGALRRFVESTDRDDWRKALEILRHCTAVRWEAKSPGTDSLEPTPVIEDYWLDELLKHHAVALGERTLWSRRCEMSS